MLSFDRFHVTLRASCTKLLYNCEPWALFFPSSLYFLPCNLLSAFPYWTPTCSVNMLQSELLLNIFISCRGMWNFNFNWFLQVFGEKSFEKFGKYFISMHFSDQHSGMHKKMLLFKFALPDANNMADISRLVALVPYYIDTVGRYKLSSQVNFIHKTHTHFTSLRTF